MKQYELMVIVDPDIGTDAIKKRLEEIKKMIAKRNGEIFFEDIWELLDLAYKIKKRETGYYAVFDINIEGEAIKELDNIFKLENEILRHMFVSLPSGYEPKIFKDS
jgi:small subunit ribosomal protein S6